MPRLEYFVVAESVSVDQNTNRVSIFNILEELRSPQFPTVIPQAVLITAWDLSPDEIGQVIPARIVIRFPQAGERRIERRVDAPITVVRRRHRMLTYLGGIGIEGVGDLEFEILVGDEHVASHIVSIGDATEEDAQRIASAVVAQ